MSYAIGEAKADFVRAQAARSLRLIPFMALQVLCLLQRQLELYHEAALYKEDRRRKRRARWVMAEASSKFMRGGFNAMGRLAARLLLKMGRKPPPSSPELAPHANRQTSASPASSMERSLRDGSDDDGSDDEDAASLTMTNRLSEARKGLGLQTESAPAPAAANRRSAAEERAVNRLTQAQPDNFWTPELLSLWAAAEKELSTAFAKITVPAPPAPYSDPASVAARAAAADAAAPRDADGVAMVTAEQLCRAMAALGARITLAEAHGMVLEVDADGELPATLALGTAHPPGRSPILLTPLLHLQATATSHVRSSTTGCSRGGTAC